MVLALHVGACHGKRAARKDAAAAAAPAKRDASIDAPSAWAELASFTKVDPVRVIALPVRAGVPRFDVGGPVVIGDVTVKESSQFGLLAVDYHAGHIA